MTDYNYIIQELISIRDQYIRQIINRDKNDGSFLRELRRDYLSVKWKVLNDSGILQTL